MNAQKPGLKLIKTTYLTSLKSLLENPRIFLPFILFSLVELAALLLVFNSPRQPLIKIFGPPIRTFWGEGFLHYPANFLLLPKLSALSRMFLAVFFGSFTTGAAVAIIVKIKRPFKFALKKYTSLFLIIFIFSALYYFIQKIIFIWLAKYFIAGHSRLLFLKSGVWLGPILFCLNFILAILIQSAFAYAIPAVVIENKKFFKATLASFAFFKRYFLATLVFVGAPILLYVPIGVFNYNAAVLMTKLFPEIILLVTILGIIISSLIIDTLVTLSVTILYQKEKLL